MAQHIQIHMYNVGFGDAFLVSIPNGDTRTKILFDCGSIESAEGQTIAQIIDRIIQDVTDPDGVPRIDVVVATHRHKDHVSGFANPNWDLVEVKEVWMPWTEDSDDAEGRRIRDIQSRLALTLDTSLRAQAPAVGTAERTSYDRYLDVVGNALMLTNDKAMKTLHHGFKGDAVRRFLPSKIYEKRSFTTSALPNVKIHAMGPDRSEDVIRDMDPPVGQSFLKLSGDRSGISRDQPMPFEAEFVQTTSGTDALLEDEDAKIIRVAGELSDFTVAVALDKAVNGTSLMLMLELSGTFLLFPGDAQWGTWKAAMADPKWRDMLSKVAFYKIGHHGSHNATPKEFVEKMLPDGASAMASTITRKMWPDIPRKQLLTVLADKQVKVVRSDSIYAVLPGGFVDDRGVTVLSIPL